jgi:hypothetical protein
MKLTEEQIKRHKILLYSSLAVIFLSTDIANIIASYSDFTDLTSIRYQVAVIIPCLIIAINSCVYLYTNAKTDKNINDITKQ